MMENTEWKWILLVRPSFKRGKLHFYEARTVVADCYKEELTSVGCEFEPKQF